MRSLAPIAALFAAVAIALGPGRAQQTVVQTPTTTFQSPTSIYSGSFMWSRTPWFYNENIRRELNITNDQYSKLQQGYQQLYTRVGPNLVTIEKLPPAEQAPRYQQWTTTMSTDFGKTAAEILNEQQMNRWRQLELQHRGYGSFYDAAVRQRLNLTQTQERQLDLLAQQYGKDMAEIYKLGATDRDTALRRYEALRKANAESMNNVLTPQQQRAWAVMTGQPFNVAPQFAPPSTKPPQP
jgi:hypothetical protein